MNWFDLARPAIFALSPETAHEASIKALKSGIVPRPSISADARLKTDLGGLAFPNPIGLAAGYDKNADVPDEVLGLGFGFTEVGTVTPLAQPGNPKPRVFRLVRDKGLINRLGFNNEGHAAALARLKARATNPGIVGVNIGANKNASDFVADYETGIETFISVASYFTVNISSPNTPGLRNLQAGEALTTLLERVFGALDRCLSQGHQAVPIFLKIAPDLSFQEMDEIGEIVSGSRLSGLIVSNTTIDRDGLTDRLYANEAGGLSGKPLFEKSTHVLAAMYQRLRGKVALIGVGGVSSSADAIAKIEAGASLVQLYTGMVYEGPGLPARIVSGLSSHLNRIGATSLDEIRGTKADQWGS